MPSPLDIADTVPLLEICVDHPGSAQAAVAGGAGRIELCAALALGGLTPSAGLVDRVLAVVGGAVPVHAMVRPRAGDFAYDEDDRALAVAEAERLIVQGVDGLVYGACADGVLDHEALARIAMVARGAQRPVALTLHRAVDCLADPVAAVEQATELGYGRILTSGGARSAGEGAARIRAMVDRAAGRVAIMAGAGITPGTVASLVAATGVREIHGSASAPARSTDRRTAMLGFVDAPRHTDAGIVAAMRAALIDAWAIRGVA